MFPSSFQHASQLDKARAAAQEDEDVSDSFRDVLSILHHGSSTKKSLLSSKLNAPSGGRGSASATSSCVQLSENHLAEVVIVSEPEGTSLQMGGCVVVFPSVGGRETTSQRFVSLSRSRSF